MSARPKATFFDIHTDVLAYLAQFLEFRDRTALALTCQGFFDTLTDPEVATLMLGGLRERMVEALVQFEEWETLAKVMHKNHPHRRAIVTRGIWKGSLPMALSCRPRPNDEILAMALVAGHHHIMSQYDINVEMVKHACNFIGELTMPVQDHLLDLVLSFRSDIPWLTLEVVLDVAASTREPGEMVDTLRACAETFGVSKMKQWCYDRAWIELGDQLFPFAESVTVPAPDKLALGRMVLSGILDHVGTMWSDEDIEEILEQHSIRVLPYNFVIQNAARVKKKIRLSKLVMLFTSHRVSLEGKNKSIFYQQYLDTCVRPDKANRQEKLHSIFTMPRDPTDVQERIRDDQKLLVPAYDWKLHATHVMVLQWKCLRTY